MLKTAVISFLMIWLALPTRAAELVMFETDSCAWCIKWHRDIGAGYARTRAQRLLPLHRVDLLEPVAPALADLGVAAVPTFVVLACGREIGRIEGYSSPGAFWSRLDRIAARVPAGC